MSARRQRKRCSKWCSGAVVLDAEPELPIASVVSDVFTGTVLNFRKHVKDMPRPTKAGRRRRLGGRGGALSVRRPVQRDAPPHVVQRQHELAKKPVAETGLAVDAIVETGDGGWAAFEVKLGQGQIDAAAESLLKFAARVDTDKCGVPQVLAVIVGTGYGYKRPDGVQIIPIGAFGP